jgi:hypothetical protein
MALARVVTISGDMISGGGVSTCTESAVRLLIGHCSVVGLIQSWGGVCICLVSFLLGFLVYKHRWQSRGSVPELVDNVMAVMIRFSAMARDESEAG